MFKRIVMSVVVICILSMYGAGHAQKASIVLLNGDVYTMEESHPWAKAVVISGNKITAVLDSADQAKPFIGSTTKVYDLKGKFVQPGFIDSHLHFDWVSDALGGGLTGDKAALKKFAEYGIVEFHDITDLGQHGDVNNMSQCKAFIQLEEQGELTCRVWMRPNLFIADAMSKAGFKPGLHPKTKQPSNYLRWGAMKGLFDGIMGNYSALFFEKYNDNNTYGGYREHTSTNGNPDLEKFYRLIKTAHLGGFTVDCHAIGDRGNHEALQAFERLKKEFPDMDITKWRIIHGQVCRLQDFKRFADLGVVVEANPNHILLDMKWMEPRIGYERCKGAYAFKTYLNNGVRLCFGSDWGGSPAEAYQPHPKYMLHGAVNRQQLDGTPKGGWFPEQKLSMAEALKAYTLRAAEATFEGDIRGSLKEGKLADIAVVDRNLMTIDPADILKIKINMTIVDGKIVYSDQQPIQVSLGKKKSPGSEMTISSNASGYTLTIDFLQQSGDFASGPVTVSVYDLHGSRTYRASVNSTRGRFVWNGTDNNGRALAAGFYYAEIDAGGRLFAKKLFLTRTGT